MKRLFAAIDIPLSDSSIATLHNIQTSLSDDRINWIPTTNMHLTLKFFGNTPGNKIKPIVQSLKKACATIDLFELNTDQLGIFGSKYNPRVLWLGFEKNPVLYQLKQNIASELEHIGYYEDRQNFVPHLTLGRIKQLQHKDFFQKVLDNFRHDFTNKILIKELVLYESILEKNGVVYKVIARIPL